MKLSVYMRYKLKLEKRLLDKQDMREIAGEVRMNS